MYVHFTHINAVPALFVLMNGGYRKSADFMLTQIRVHNTVVGGAQLCIE